MRLRFASQRLAGTPYSEIAEFSAPYGLKYEVNESTRALLEGVGVDVAKFNGSGGWILPAPAVFVIDRMGIVRLAGANGDFMRRVEPDDVLAAVDSLDS